MRFLPANLDTLLVELADLDETLALFDALLADLNADLQHVHGRPLTSIFFGGGTPSLFSARSMAAIVEGLAQSIAGGDVPETIEDKQLYTLDLGALVDQPAQFQCRIHGHEGGLHPELAGHHHVIAGDDAGGGLAVGGNQAGGDVAGADVLDKRGGDIGGQGGLQQFRVHCGSPG